MDHQQEEINKIPGQVYSDHTLEKVVTELLNTSKTLDASGVTVIAHNGDITLNGTVKNEQQKNAAGAMTQLVHGVGQIRNNLAFKN